MSNVNIRRLRPMERWSPTLTLAASVLFVGHTVVRAMEALSITPQPVDVFGPAGYVAAGLALSGLLPGLVDDAPTLSRLAAGTAFVTVPAWTLIACWSFGEAAGLLPSQSTVLPATSFIAVILLTLLLYLLFGTASLRAEAHTRTLGLLLLTPAGVLVFLMVGSVVLSITPETGAVAVGCGLVISHGAIGGTLSIGRTETDHVAPSADATRE